MSLAQKHNGPVLPGEQTVFVNSQTCILSALNIGRKAGVSGAISQIDMYTEKKKERYFSPVVHTCTCTHTHAGKVLDLNFQCLAAGIHGALKETRLAG